MVSVELGDKEETARKYCKDGELSRFLRWLIERYDNEQTLIPETETKDNILHTLVYFILGMGFFIIACSTIFDILTTLTATFLIICSLFLFIYTYLNIIKHKKNDEVKKEWI